MSTSNKHICPTKSLKILGDFWTLEIIQTLFSGEKRFAEIEKTIKGVNPATLSSRLKKLERFGLILRKKEIENKLSVSYSLTKKGLGIIPIMDEIQKFSKKYLT